MNFLFAPPSSDDFIRLLKAWKFWLLGALVGALIGAALYYLALPPYRAHSSVDVDFHLEQAWPGNGSTNSSITSNRRRAKLEEIAWSDAVLNQVASQVKGVTVDEIRGGKLQLSQPANGGWHFFADDKDPNLAAALASAWAQAFTVQVHTEVIASSTSGLEPYITVDADQIQNIPTRRLLSVSTYLLAGAVVFLLLAPWSFCFSTQILFLQDGNE